MKQTADVLTSIVDWFKLAKPEPTVKNILTQLGCHFEEIHEMTQAMGFQDTRVAHEINNLSVALKQADDNALSNVINERPKEVDIELLDSLCDQIVTAIGVAHDFGYDIMGALAEVNQSNWSKFDENGQPIFDENGKIAKGNNYRKPDLLPYI